jgi:hypothetical protein
MCRIFMDCGDLTRFPARVREKVIPCVQHGNTTNATMQKTPAIGRHSLAGRSRMTPAHIKLRPSSAPWSPSAMTCDGRIPFDLLSALPIAPS